MNVWSVNEQLFEVSGKEECAEKCNALLGCEMFAYTHPLCYLQPNKENSKLRPNELYVTGFLNIFDKGNLSTSP